MMVFDEATVTTAIFNLLKEVHSRVFNNRAERGTVFPYIVYNIKSPFQQDNNKTQFILEINILENKGHNIRELVELTTLISKKFHKCTYNDSNMMIHFYQESLLLLDDPDINPNDVSGGEQIRKRQLNINCNYRNKKL